VDWCGSPRNTEGVAVSVAALFDICHKLRSPLMHPFLPSDVVCITCAMRMLQRC
jgi:hypothetical protein